MELIAVIGIIYFVAALLAWITRIDIAYLFAPAIFLIAGWEYIFGLLGYLNLGMESLVLTICITMLMFVIKNEGFRRSLIESVFAPSTIAFVSLSLISLYKSKDWLLSQWDEFSHWGLFTKAMYEYGALAPATPVDMWNAKYPPSISLFQYFIMDFSGEWREGLLFWSMHLIAISVIVAILTKSTFRYKSEILFKLYIVIVASSSFLNSFDTIYQDPLLAILFGFLIVVAINTSHLDGRWTIILALTAGFVSLVKPVGVYFAVTAILINIVATLFTQKVGSGRKLASAYAPALLSLATIGVAWTTWRYFCNRFGVESSGISSALPTGFNNLTNREEVISNFITAFVHANLRPSYSVPMSPFIWIIVCGLFFVIWTLLDEKRSLKRNIAIGVTLLITTVGYFGVILLSYLTVFGPGEAAGLASYARYIGTWYQGVLFAIVILILSQFGLAKYFDPDFRSEEPAQSLKARKQVGLLLVAFVGFTTLSSVHNYMLMLSVSSTQGSEVRKPFIPVVEAIKKAKIPEQSKVYIVAQHTAGFEYFVLRYEMAGNNFGQVPWSMGSTYGEGDVWTDPTWDKEKWSNALRDFDYVVLYKTSEDFNSEFGSLFDSGIVDPNTVYKVIKTPGNVSLSKVG